MNRTVRLMHAQSHPPPSSGVAMSRHWVQVEQLFLFDIQGPYVQIVQIRVSFLGRSRRSEWE